MPDRVSTHRPDSLRPPTLVWFALTVIVLSALSSQAWAEVGDKIPSVSQFASEFVWRWGIGLVFLAIGRIAPWIACLGAAWGWLCVHGRYQNWQYVAIWIPRGDSYIYASYLALLPTPVLAMIGAAWGWFAPLWSDVEDTSSAT